MSTMVRQLLVIAAALLACVVGPRAWGQNGQQITVQLQAPQRMYVGDTQDIQIVVTGSRNVSAPDLSGLRDFEVVYRAPQDMSSTMTTIVNGRVDTKVSITYGHLYAITPRRAGRLEIPPITVVVDGKSYVTQEAVVEVIEPVKGEGFRLDLSVDHTRAFVGQPILVRMAWTLGKNVAGVQLTLPIDGAEHEVMLGPVTRPLNQNSTGTAVVPLNGTQVLGSYDQHVLVLDRVIVPKAAGTITVGSARADYLTVVGERPRGPLDFPFGNQQITERQFSAAPPIEISVEEVPAAGRPADFSGLVGKYEISSSVDSTNVSVGEPINLMVGVAGPYPPSLVPAMDFSAQKDLKSHFRVPREPVLAQTTPTAAMFQAMIRARSDAVKQVDPIRLNYFDPEARQYRVAQTKAIPLTVKASTTVGLPDEPEQAEAPTPVRRARPGGLPDIVREGATSGAGVFDLREAATSRAGIALVAGPPMVWALVGAGIGVRRWRRRDPEGARRAAAVKRLRRTLKRPVKSVDGMDATARAVANFAADWFNEPPDTLTGPAAAGLLERDGTGAGKSLADVLRECDAARFGGVRGGERPDAAGLAARAMVAARGFGAEMRAGAQGRAA